MTSDLHVVFGTGAIGLTTIEVLAARGTPVRAVSRSGRTDVPEGVEVMTGDATDSAFATEAASGATVVYQCLNPPYTQWPELFPPLQAAVLEGAVSAGAKYVAMDNLYAYGPTGGALAPRGPAVRGDRFEGPDAGTDGAGPARSTSIGQGAGGHRTGLRLLRPARPALRSGRAGVLSGNRREESSSYGEPRPVPQLQLHPRHSERLGDAGRP